MRAKRIFQAAPLVAVALLASACDKGLTDVNVNPNQPEVVRPEHLFPQAVTSAVNLVRGSGFDMTFTGLWAQHYAKISYVDEDRYEIRPTTIDGWWSNFYSGGLMDLQKTIEFANGEAGGVAPAMVMQSWTFAQMTDIWGDIPYSDALKGDQKDGALTPKYDTQKVVYDGILKSLVDASTKLGGARNTLGGADPIYSGSPAKWQKFANSLRARYGMRLSEVDPAKAQAEVKAAFAAGVFTGNADNAVLEWPGDGSSDHPFYTFYRGRPGDHRVSATMVDTLKHLNDPRLPVYARMPTDETVTHYAGVPNGLSDDAAKALGNAKTSMIGLFFSSANSASYLMTYSEVLFIQAEAVARGWLSGDAEALYKQAITANMQVYGIKQADIDAYLAQPRVQYNPATGRQQIALQKWISLFGQGTEAYAEVRRTNTPVLIGGPTAITPNQAFATRLTYPLAEQSTNNANLTAAMSAQGNVSLVGKVWWDK